MEWLTVDLFLKLFGFAAPVAVAAIWTYFSTKQNKKDIETLQETKADKAELEAIKKQSENNKERLDKKEGQLTRVLEKIMDDIGVMKVDIATIKGIEEGRRKEREEHA